MPERVRTHRSEENTRPAEPRIISVFVVQIDKQLSLLIQNKYAYIENMCNIIWYINTCIFSAFIWDWAQITANSIYLACVYDNQCIFVVFETGLRCVLHFVSPRVQLKSTWIHWIYDEFITHRHIYCEFRVDSLQLNRNSL